MNKLNISAALQIHKPASEIYEAIIDPVKMSGYFISESTGPMVAGTEVEWKFPEFDERYAVQVLETIPDEKVVFEWEGAKGVTTKVSIVLEPKDNGATVVRVSEGELDNNEEGIKWLKVNTEGWGNFLACMKCYLEHGINLRTGGYDHMK